MVTNSKQRWEIGQTVSVGFVRNLVVKAAIPTPGDFAPDAYILTNAAGTQFYQFVPHNGLQKLDLLEAREILAAAAYQAKQIADAALAKAKRDSEAVAAINAILFAAA